MNFIVIISADGLVQKVAQDEALYQEKMAEIRASNPTFSAYSDDNAGLFYDVIGSNFHVRYKVASDTTSTTTTTSTSQP